VGLKEQLGRLGRRGDDDGVGAEAEVHELAVLLGELVDGAVRERADQVEVADHRPWSRTRREAIDTTGRLAFHTAEDHDGEHHDKGGDD
jgi:hypothetical protein